VKLILDWARAERAWSVNVDAAAGDLGEVFENKQIRRESTLDRLSRSADAREAVAR
jgi:hypothetical protein